MNDLSPARANAALWSAHLTNEWDAWLGFTHLDSTHAAQQTGAVIAVALAPWLALLTGRERLGAQK